VKVSTLKASPLTRLSALIVPLTVPEPSQGAVVPPLTRNVPENCPSVCEVIDQTSLQVFEMLATPDVNVSSRETAQLPIRLEAEGGAALVGELPPQAGTMSSDNASAAIVLIVDHRKPCEPQVVSGIAIPFLG
jgi:hypothetical protein